MSYSRVQPDSKQQAPNVVPRGFHLFWVFISGQWLSANGNRRSGLLEELKTEYEYVALIAALLATIAWDSYFNVVLEDGWMRRNWEEDEALAEAWRDTVAIFFAVGCFSYLICVIISVCFTLAANECMSDRKVRTLVEHLGFFKSLPVALFFVGSTAIGAGSMSIHLVRHIRHPCAIPPIGAYAKQSMSQRLPERPLRLSFP